MKSAVAAATGQPEAKAAAAPATGAIDATRRLRDANFTLEDLTRQSNKPEVEVMTYAEVGDRRRNFTHVQNLELIHQKQQRKTPSNSKRKLLQIDCESVIVYSAPKTSLLKPVLVVD